ncbi:hypothetical protein STSP2_01254 [Anaerohalosphaera lusitana]|uniref:Ig-like domain-containing protein n=1 Tax=Anaerohalosphaera lusitana TaxID=1936003 RepID=A0A1U9NJJ8_9BACT|nr:LamG-like jellyroll fold domain-containing protein [Anaerohalosphaera lusitana]AQT68099.1 hypothetical protein STSP2_01254 [Anaerohalosphaera lusitana]
MSIISKRIVLCWLCMSVLLVANSVLAQAPETFTQNVTHDGQTITLQMVKDSVRGPDFEVLVQNAQGNYNSWQPGEVRTYIGTVYQRPDAYAAGILLDNGTFKARVNFDRGKSWWTLGNSVYDTHGTQSTTYNIPTMPTVSPGKAGSSTYSFGVGFDSDYQYYARRGSVADCLEMMEFTAINVKAQYLQNVMLMPELGRVIIRPYSSQCPYEGVGGNLLGEFRTHWNTYHPVSVAPRDVAALVSPTIGGGVAWVGVIGSGFAYSSNGIRSDGSFDGVWRHELGHNWGTSDYHAGSPEGPTMMCGNKYARFNGPAVKSIFDHRDSRIDRFTNLGTYSKVNLPPYAAMDFLEGIHAGQSVTIDVMANDHDVNGQDLTFYDFETSSSQGGTITLSAGTGPNGRDELIYTAPIGLFNAKDYFHYTIRDSAGARSTGVIILSLSRNLTIIGQPVDEYVIPDEQASFAVDAVNPFTGDDTGLSFQWKYSADGSTYSNVAGGTGSTLTIAAPQSSDQGFYYCDVTIDSNGEMVSSETAQLVVKQTLAHWTMDQDDFVNGKYVDIAGSYDAGTSSVPTFVTGAGPDEPAFGAAVINPDSDAVAGTWNPLESTGQMTISAWVKWNGTIGEYGNDILSKGDSWGPDTMMWAFKIRGVSSGKAGIWFYSQQDTGIRSAGQVPEQIWTHISLVYDSGQARLYVNGKLITTHDNFTLGTGTASTLKIGGGGAFPGAMDEVTIHNYAMSDEDAATLYYETSQEAVCLNPPSIDLNDDCRVNLSDLLIMAESWADCGLVPECRP